MLSQSGCHGTKCAHMAQTIQSLSAAILTMYTECMVQSVNV